MLLDEGYEVGPYVIETLIGRGGMGSVYRARDSRLGRRVALKFLDPEGAVGADPRRLLREARAASALNHTNICQVYDVGVEGDRSWIAMEYVEGCTLAETLPPGGLPPDSVVRLGCALAGALVHAHVRGIVHRDLKPSNIVCTGEGTPKILDFGIASRLPQAVAEEMTRTRTCGTLGPARQGPCGRFRAHAPSAGPRCALPDVLARRPPHCVLRPVRLCRRDLHDIS